MSLRSDSSDLAIENHVLRVYGLDSQDERRALDHHKGVGSQPQLPVDLGIDQETCFLLKDRFIYASP